MSYQRPQNSPSRQNRSPGQHLLSIPAFRHLPAAAVQRAAPHLRVLRIPKGRWVITRPRQLSAYLYLLYGRLSILPKCPARQSEQQAYFFPGCHTARSVTRVGILHIPAAQHKHLLAQATHPATANTTAATEADSTSFTESMTVEPTEPWLQRFLQSAMMQNLSKADWQQLMAGLRSNKYLPGERIVQQGEAGTCCYILQSGQAVVHRHDQTLCHLAPGDLFGEDALITGQRRNADVTAVDHVAALQLPNNLFVELLLNKNTEFVEAGAQMPGASSTLYIASALSQPPAEEHICLSPESLREQINALAANTAYHITGGNLQQRALAAFLMAQRGLQAYPLADPQATQYQ